MNLMNITKISRFCGLIIALLALAVVLPNADAQDSMYDVLDPIYFQMGPKPPNVVPKDWGNNNNLRSTDNPTVWMPDANLRAAVTEQLNALDPSLTLTKRNLTLLSHIHAEGEFNSSIKIRPITNLKGLEHATNLEWIDLKINNITDLTPLSGLTNLTSLGLGWNNITNLTLLSGLTNLEYLGLEANVNNDVYITDISALPTLTNMKSLDLSGNDISDISVLSPLTSLTYLSLTGNNVTDISVLSNFSELESFSLHNNTYASTTPLDISALADLTNLNILSLGYNSVDDIADLASLTNLTYLFLEQNNITVFSHLSGLTNLVGLGLGGNNVDNNDLTNISGLTQLTYLDLSKNEISNISHLSNLVNLLWLELQDNNNISDISHLSNMANLEKLFLSNNNISDISHLSNMANLEKLFLKGNSINIITDLRDLYNLEKVYLSANPVWDIPANVNTIDTLRARSVEVIIDDLVPVNQILPPDIDVTEPTVSITVPADPQNSSFRVSVVFNEAVSGFELTELVLDPTTVVSTSSTAFEITDDNTTYTADFTPTTSGTVTFSVDAGVATDNFYNPNLAATSQTVTVDLVAPGVSLTVPSGTQNAAFEVTFTFTEPITDFTASSVELGGLSAEISEPQQDSTDEKVYTAIITPIDTNAGNITIDLPEDVLTDEAGNGNTAATTLTVPVDLPPQISFDIPLGTQYEAFAVTISFSESVTDFAKDDIKLGGTATADIELFSRASPSDYSLQITPTSQGNLIINVRADAVMDATNNGNTAVTFKPVSVDLDFVIEFPDANLASTFRYWMRLDDDEDITKSEIVKLPHLWDTFPDTISNLSGLEHATGLQVLILAGNDIVDVSPLAGLTALTELDLSTNEIVDISHLSGLTSLTRLDLTENDVADISSLSNLTSLTFLDLTTNEVSDIAPLSTLTSLETLFLSENSITDISALERVTALTRLYLDNNSITNVETLARLVNLTELKLSDNEILDTSPLYNLSQQSSPIDIDIEVAEHPPWDVNEDGSVDTTDSALVTAALGQTGDDIVDPNTDVNGDGTVDQDDLTLVTDNIDSDGGAPSNSSLFTMLDQQALQKLDRGVLESYLNILRAESDGSLKYERAIAILERVLVMTRPKQTELLANYPNPFNPETWIPYHLANASAVRITIYDVHGTVVRHLDLGHQREGYYTNRSRAAYWDGRNDSGERVASGVYFYQLQADNTSLLRKMVILK